MRYIQVNYLGLYRLTRAIYPLLKRSTCGRIVMVGSRAVFAGYPGMAGYIESKAAVMGLTRMLARELGDGRHYCQCRSAGDDRDARHARALRGGCL